MDLAYVDKLANINNDVKYLLVCQNLFDETVDAKRMNAKKFQRNCSGFSKCDYGEELTQKILGRQMVKVWWRYWKNLQPRRNTNSLYT